MGNGRATNWRFYAGWFSFFFDRPKKSQCLIYETILTNKIINKMNKFYSYIIGTVIFTIMGFIIYALSTEDDNDTEVPEEENPSINDNSEDPV